MDQNRQLKNILVTMLETNIAILEFQSTLTNVEKEKKGIKEWIKRSKKAIKVVENIEHNEILASLYNAFVNGKESYFVAIDLTLTEDGEFYLHELNWDKTKKGFKEFLEKEKQAVKDDDANKKEKIEMAEMIKRAKQEGKKVEFMYVNKKLKPVIVNEKPN